MIPAATYARASSEHQCYSTANQSAALADYAGAHGYQVVQTYEDDGCSGLDIRGRPGLRALIRQVLEPNCPFRALLVYDVSRWGRFQDPDESAYYEFLCRRSGVDVLYCAEAFSSEHGAMAALLKNIKRTMAAEYSRELSLKVAAGKRRLASLGFAQSNSGYGFRRGLVDHNGVFKGVLQPGQRKAIQTDRIIMAPGPPKHVAAVRLIFRLYVREGWRFCDIAKELNRRGVPSPAGALWQGQGVRHILRNDRYVGDLVYGRTHRRLKGPVSKMPPDTWTRAVGVYKGIVSRETFAAAQRKMQQLAPRPRADEFLPKLKALLDREGYLTPALIDAQPDMPKANSYASRFGGLIQAYRAIGYLSPRDPSEDWEYSRASKARREALLAALAGLFARKGYLTAELINGEPDTPSFRVYQWAFGSLYAAYQLIGYSPPKSGRFTPRMRKALADEFPRARVDPTA